MSDQQKAIAITLCALVAIGVYMGVDYAQKKDVQKQCTLQSGPQVSAHILSITQPTHIFSGYVDKIKGNIMVVSLFQKGSPIHSPFITPSPTPTQPNVTYEAVINANTIIAEAPVSPFYLFKVEPVKSSSPPLTLKDIEVGTLVAIETPLDLRVYTGTQLQVSRVTVTKNIYTYVGDITRIEGNVVGLASQVQDAVTGALQRKEFDVLMSDDTEVSHFNSENEKPPLKAVRLTFEDLRYGMRVTIYTDKDINKGGEIKVLRADPEMFGPVIPTP